MIRCHCGAEAAVIENGAGLCAPCFYSTLEPVKTDERAEREGDRILDEIERRAERWS